MRLSKALADDPSGLRLDRIRHGGAAWNAGLRSGDYVLFVNELPVYSYEGGLHLLSRVDGATPTILMVSRGGETVRVEIPVPTE